MVIQKVQRGAQGEAIEPQTDLRQLHGHRVKIDAVDAPLEDVPLEQIYVGQLLFRVQRHALLLKRLLDLLPSLFESEIHRVDRELIEELKQVVGDEIDGLDQEV